MTTGTLEALRLKEIITEATTGGVQEKRCS